MEVGYRLIPMVDFQQDGELLGRIRSIRKKFAQDMGFLPPVVHIRDNMDLPPARYRILMKGVEIGSGDAYPGRWLAINPGTAAGTLPGEQTIDPAFGLAAIWIESALKEQAQIQGYTVVEASTVVATHLNHLIGQFSAELFGRQEAQQLLDRVTQEMPKLTEDLVPGVVTLTTLHKVLQNLLEESADPRYAHHSGNPGRTCAAAKRSARADGGGSRGAGPCDYPAVVPGNRRSAGYWP
jgi:flagellar biosynthesis protein FlhA